VSKVLLSTVLSGETPAERPTQLRDIPLWQWSIPQRNHVIAGKDGLLLLA
jgi:hypothetical protein